MSDFQTAPKSHPITDTVRARVFGRMQSVRVAVTGLADSDVLVWDDVAGHYTRNHSMSRRVQQRIIREVMARAVADETNYYEWSNG